MGLPEASDGRCGPTDAGWERTDAGRTAMNRVRGLGGSTKGDANYSGRGIGC